MIEKIATDFGFAQVSPEEKNARVQGVFSSVARKYDIMNDLMSAGVHRLWKRNFVGRIPVFEGAKMLDVAGGTGDISTQYYLHALRKNKQVDITVTDRNSEMLAEGKKRALNRGITELAWQEADAEALPFEDNSFDVVTIAFGIRNVTHKDKALQEFHRVLKPGGKFLCLEFSQVPNDALKRVYEWYSFKIIPKVGRVVTKDADSYQYLVESISNFPKAEEFQTMLDEAGFLGTSFSHYSQGIVAAHVGYK